MRPPDEDKRDAQQQTDQNITPKRPKPQAEAMHHQISTEHADVSIASAEEGFPFAHGLQRYDGDVDADDDLQDVAEEIEEVDLRHWLTATQCFCASSEPFTCKQIGTLRPIFSACRSSSSARRRLSTL